MNDAPVDPGMPQFHRSWDPQEARDSLERALRCRDGWRLETVEIDRIRHRIGLRGIVQYEVRLARGEEKAEALVAGSTYAGDHAAAVGRALEHEETPPDSPFLRLAGYDPGLGMVFQVFPLDRRLPGLRRLAGLSAAGAGRALGFPPDARIVPARHRLGLAATLRVESAAGQSFVKFYPEGAAPSMHRRQADLQDCAGGAVNLAAHGRLLAPLDAIVSDASPGLPLAGSRPATALIEAIADAIARLHAAPPGRMTATGDTPQRRAQRASGWLPFVLPESGPLLESLPALEGTPESTLVHGDLKPEHVLMSQTSVTFIDLDSAGVGRPLSDLASLVARLPEDAGAALLDRYRRQCPGRDWSAWEVEWALASAKLALFHAQHRKPGWRDAALGALRRRCA